MAGNAKSTFIKGFWALLPTAITIIVLVKIYELVSGTIGGGLRKVVVWVVALWIGWILFNDHYTIKNIVAALNASRPSAQTPAQAPAPAESKPAP